MDSGGYYWPQNGTENRNMQTGVTSSEFIQQATSQQQEQPAQVSSMSSAANTIVKTQSSNSTGYSRQQENSTELQLNSNPNPVVDTPMPIEISNPDAIEPKARTYTCRICQMMFPNKSAVTVHSRIHTDHQGKPYRCSFCDKGFSTNFYLKQHERIHSGQKPYKCPMCEQSFKQLSHVQQHVRTHTGVRPYKCHWPGCGKAFLQQSHLKSHEARHTPKNASGEKPYKCHWPDCGKSFGQLTNLKSHVARHTPNKSRSRKGASSQKKSEEPKNENQTSTMSLQDVINQAAAAADIVPDTSTNTAAEESEIRPFLCPGCSKVYVREATFKKHLEECKTKLQLSISATASALGIEPSTADTMINFNPGRVQQINTPSLPEKILKKEANNITFTTQTVTPNHSTAASDSSATSKPNVVQVKKEPPVGTAPQVAPNLVPQQNLSSTNSFKLEQVPNTVSATAASSSQNSILHYDTSTGQVMSVAEAALTTGAPLQQAPENYLFSTAHAPTVVDVSSGNIPTTSTEHLVEGVNPPATEHSTINQAAIRWQWDHSDQPVPGLNFP